MNTILEDLQDAITEASAADHILRYMGNLRSANPAKCLLIYVIQPTADLEPGECISVETPVEIGLRMKGGLHPDEIVGIFALDEADEAVGLLEMLLAELPSGSQAEEPA